MTIAQKLSLIRLHQLRDAAPSINAYFPAREAAKGHAAIAERLTRLGLSETVSLVEIQPGMKALNIWEVFDFMIRRYKFGLSNKDQHGFDHYKIESGIRRDHPPVKYRLKPISKTEQTLGKFF